MLTIEERMKLAQIGSKVMSAMNLLNNGYKSMNSYDEFEILKNGYQNIGDALKISEATSEIFKIHNIPNLKELYLSNKYNIDDIFRLRHLENAKVYREWINNFNSELDTKQFTEDYFLEATNSKSYWESNKGKLFKELGVFGISMSAGTLIGGLAGSLIGLPIGIVTGYFIDSIVKSRNPKIYIDNLKKDLK